MAENKKAVSFVEKNCFEFTCQVSNKKFDNNKRRYSNNGPSTLFFKKQRYVFCQTSIV